MRLARENRAAPDPDARAESSGQTTVSPADSPLDGVSVAALRSFFALLDHWDQEEGAMRTDVGQEKTTGG